MFIIKSVKKLIERKAWREKKHTSSKKVGGKISSISVNEAGKVGWKFD